jgi:hypothetical protein
VWPVGQIVWIPVGPEAEIDHLGSFQALIWRPEVENGLAGA